MFVIFFLSCMGSTQVYSILFFVPFGFSYLLLHNKSPQNLWLKTVPTDDLTVSVTQESGHSFLGLLFRNSHRLHKVLAGGTVISGLTWAWIYFQVPLCGCWQGLDFHGLLDQGLNFSLAFAQRPPTVPCYMAHSIRHLTTWQPHLSERRL